MKYHYKITRLIELFGKPYGSWCTYYDDPYDRSSGSTHVTGCGAFVLHSYIIKLNERCKYCGKLVRWAV